MGRSIRGPVSMRQRISVSVSRSLMSKGVAAYVGAGHDKTEWLSAQQMKGTVELETGPSSSTYRGWNTRSSIHPSSNKEAGRTVPLSNPSPSGSTLVG
jgi:hypothetical protein